MLIVLLVASWIVRALDKTCGIGCTCELFLVLVASRIIMVSVLDRTCRIVGASDLFFVLVVSRIVRVLDKTCSIEGISDMPVHALQDLETVRIERKLHPDPVDRARRLG
jgi:hypothetical protein